MRSRVFLTQNKTGRILCDLAANPWGSKLLFGVLLAEYTSGAWVHSVAFSPSGKMVRKYGMCWFDIVGNQLVWSNRASELSLVNKTGTNGENAQPTTVRCKFLPFTCLLWIDETSFLGVGHEYSPVLFEVVNGQVVYRKKIGVPSSEKESSQNSAFKMFRDINRTASNQESNDIRPNSLHQNAVKYAFSLSISKSPCFRTMKSYATNQKGVSKFSTSGLDGVIAIWDLKVCFEGSILFDGV